MSLWLIATHRVLRQAPGVDSAVTSRLELPASRETLEGAHGEFFGRERASMYLRGPCWILGENLGESERDQNLRAADRRTQRMTASSDTNPKNFG